MAFKTEFYLKEATEKQLVLDGLERERLTVPQKQKYR